MFVPLGLSRMKYKYLRIKKYVAFWGFHMSDDSLCNTIHPSIHLFKQACLCTVGGRHRDAGRACKLLREKLQTEFEPTTFLLCINSRALEFNEFP